MPRNKEKGGPTGRASTNQNIARSKPSEPKLNDMREDSNPEDARPWALRPPTKNPTYDGGPQRAPQVMQPCPLPLLPAKRGSSKGPDPRARKDLVGMTRAPLLPMRHPCSRRLVRMLL